jgi:hypothetical protein
MKSVTSGTHLITRHTLPRWPCKSIEGRILLFEQHTTKRCSLSPLTWTLISARPIVCTYVGFAAHILRAEIRACAYYASLHAWLGTRSVATSRESTRHCVLIMFAQWHLYPPSVLRPAVYKAARHREWHVVCTRFSCHVPGTTTKEHGLGTYGA